MITLNKFLIFLVVAGLSITFFYGFQWWYSTQAVEKVTHEEMNDWHSSPKEKVKIASIEEKSDEDENAVYSENVDAYEKGEATGRLVIPHLEKGYTTYWGADEESLDQGVGMYVSEWTTTPDQKRHTVLSGHRETVFTKLGDIEKGESIFYEYDGKRYEYEVDKSWVTEEDDLTVIVDMEDPTLTLTTCYPFDFVGSAPERYILQSKLVSVQDIE